MRLSKIVSQRCVVGFMALTVLAWCWSALGEEGGVKKQVAAIQQKTGPTPMYHGAGLCSSCHKVGTFPDPKVCSCKEFDTWDTEDKHKHAYAVLQQPRAQQMQKLLGYKVTEDKRCVGCHGVYFKDPQVKADSEKQQFKIEEGVSCMVCHGGYTDWVLLQHHFDQTTWRKYSRQEKEEKFGLADLWDPAKRTALCANCHVGNAADGIEVTHEMYAAGHPPLPSFEAATFSDKMPRHWQYLKEKKPEVQKLLQVNVDEAKFEVTKLVAVSSIATLRSSMQLLAHDAERAAQGKDAQQQGLDLAHFDCFACHHDLKAASWRQERGYVGKPGRPQMSSWQTVLVPVGVRQAGKDPAQFQGEVKKLYAAFDAQPFGDAAKVALAAKQMVAWSNQIIADVEKSKLDRAGAIRLLRETCTIGAKELLDYDSARQVAWAFESIYHELKPLGPSDAQIDAKLAAMHKDFKLTLPASVKVELLKELPSALETRNNYEAKNFKTAMEELMKLLPKG